MATSAVLAAALLVVGLAACEGGIPGSERERTIPRETFIQAMVDLRLAAVESPGDPVTQARRDRVLEELGVTPEQLVHFAEVHGRNVPYMNDVWNEVQQRLLERAEEEGEEEDPAPPRPIRPPATGPGS
jgi:hypothetical protein